ncbi:transcriptional regulator, ArsR family [Corynebacterium lipophiloflavum DSM 44291]|uniref:Transcriptional regulator, ArsR family n=1 Tax=Corynebacterium lipophiloflavum (strain ATCC 700352 / DSM 44291 / CCUG 37336 / JCM 10383 / DMMZ 1944) TaxID=525263 RepID=C0XRP2_CORLD|nr:metalloregulator ArsR/SmtB family transcription factor [Corynebacterium lipophiloflavum]EEI17092.1 transcriptional regulator, ArsR family [Corynebacterium lipophiloflavum DSM 44291]
MSALDSPLRLQILLLLHTSPHVVHQIVSKLEKSQPLISQHLRVLKKSGLVDATRAGREVVYSLAEPAIIDIIFQLADLAVVHCAGEGNDELASRRLSDATTIRDQRSSSGAAAIIDPPSDIRPQRDPGLAPFTPGPTRE